MSEETLQAIIEEECRKNIKTARTQIKKILESATLSLMGIKSDVHRGYEIDHCNGRNSVLIDAFRECAIEEAKDIAKNYKPTPESIVHFAATFENEFNRRLNDEIKGLAKARAKEEAAKIVDAIKVDVNKVLTKNP